MIQFISVYRFLAMVLVVFGHLVSVPTYSYIIPNVIKGTLATPIMPDNSFVKFDLFLLLFQTNSGSLGVVMFFIASGYLAAKMMDRYTRKEYLVNRVVSIFPTLWTSIAVVVLFVFISQGITFTMQDYLASLFPFFYNVSGSFIVLALWTIRIEISFYIMVFICGKNRIGLVIYGYILILLVAIIYYEFKLPWLYYMMSNLSFVCFALLGVLLEYVQRKNVSNGLKYIAACVIFNILMFKIFASVFQDGDFRALYSNCSTQIIPVVLFILFAKLEQKHPGFYQRVPGFVYSSGNVLLPLYLTHVACGITVMYHMSNAGFNIYLTLLGGVITSFVVAYIIYWLVMKPSTSLMKKMVVKMRQ